MSDRHGLMEYGPTAVLCKCGAVYGTTAELEIHRLQQENERLRTGIQAVIGSLETGAYGDGFNGPAGFDNVDHAVEWALERLRALSEQQGGQE